MAASTVTLPFGALRILAFATHYLDWDHATAETYFRRASELGPNDAVVLSWYGDFLTNVRRFDEARVYYKRAQDASPRWLEPATFAANIHVLMGNPDLAIAEYRRALESEPNFDERHMGFYFPSADPIYELMWSHPRFRTLMQRLNLPAF